MKTLILNKSGFTLIEMMFAMMISLLGIFAMLQSMELVTHTNVQNEMRDEAVKIAQEKMKEMLYKSPTFDDIAYVPYSTVHRGNHRFVVTEAVEPIPAINANSKELVVKVGWSYKNISSHHEMHSIKSR